MDGSPRDKTHQEFFRGCGKWKDMTARGQMLIAANMAGAAFQCQVGLWHALAHTVAEI